ncbi:MAG: hypothetical protein CM1200mP3_09690 [Chloroflexota bacterium]|nr:MAG: hypothetical protein CM1200mP3_09690 [Chloroflexota bacterium]
MGSKHMSVFSHTRSRDSITLENSSGTGMAAAMGASLALVPLGGLLCIIPAAIVLKITKNSTYTGVCAFLIAMVCDWLIVGTSLKLGPFWVCTNYIFKNFLVQYRNLKD